MMRKPNNNKAHAAIFLMLLGAQALPLYAQESAALNGEATLPRSEQGAQQAGAEKNAQQPAATGAREIKSFDIFEYRVDGNTKLNTEQIEKAVYPYLGEGKSIADVDKAREALEAAYHQAGFLTVFVDLPEQEVDGKIVRLNVTEGKVSHLRVKDSHYFTLGRIKALAPSVQEGEVPHFPTVQSDIARLNRTTDKRVTPVMRAGKVFGTVDVDLKVEDTLPFHASLELNDKYSRDTTRLRLGGMVRYDNLWQREHSLSLNFLLSPENIDEVKVLSANYLMRFDESDMLLALYGVRSNSSVATVGGISILGNGSILGLRLIKPLPALDKFNHSISLGLDYKSFGQTVEFGGRIETPVTYMPLSAVYSATWQDATGITQLTSGLTLGIRGLVAKESEFDNKRPGASGLPYSGAKSNFFVVKAEVQRTQTLPFDLQGFAQLDGQFSGQPLISNEQYLAGGADTVRGYLEAEVAGDQAVHTTLEIRSPSLLRSQSWLQELRLASFYDAAWLHTIDPAVGLPAQSFVSGAGLSLRAKAWKRFNADLNVAWALKDGAVTRKGDVLSHMRFWYEF